MDKLGIVIVGINGAVSSTLIAGVELMKSNLVPRLGMITERRDASIAEPIADAFDYISFDKMEFAGWDIKFSNVYEAAIHHNVLPKEHLLAIRDKLEAIKPWSAAFNKLYVKNISGENCIHVPTFREEISIFEENIKAFKIKNNLTRLVMLNIASTECYLEIGEVHKSLDAFEKGLDNNDLAISPAMRYFYAANKLSIPFCNFTPSLTNIPALAEQALKYSNPYAGMDGKTGQTLVKTALASMFRIRHLYINGWYSTNILGNNDGLALNSPESNKTKVNSKKSALDSIMGYPVENHQVHIHYYKPRGDAKEAWDNIDIAGFCGIPMQMKINFLCQDSILAAPLLIDIIRLLDVAKCQGEKGIQRQLSLFFKSPFCAPNEAPMHDLFKQEQLLLEWITRLK